MALHTVPLPPYLHQSPVQVFAAMAIASFSKPLAGFPGTVYKRHRGEVFIRIDRRDALQERLLLQPTDTSSRPDCNAERVQSLTGQQAVGFPKHKYIIDANYQ